MYSIFIQTEFHEFRDVILEAFREVVGYNGIYQKKR